MIRWSARAAVGLSALLFGISAQGAPPTDAEYPHLKNLIQNASFEMDWMHNAVSSATRFLLLDQSDWGYGQSDGIPDSWVCREGRLDRAVHKFGSASLRSRGDAWQVIYVCGETDPKGGGAYYNPFRPLPAELCKVITPRPLRVGVWCKTQDATQPPELTLDPEYAEAGKAGKRKSVAFAKGTHEWEYQEIILPADAAAGPVSSATVHLINRGEGSVWFDGAFAVEEEAKEERNLLPNGTFQTVENGWPVGWSKPELWSWSRQEYYRFAGWSHEAGKMVGGIAWPRLGPGGGRVLQLTVLPGDNISVHAYALALNQSDARPLRVAAWVRADNLRWFEIMAKDENGEWLPQQDFAGSMGTDADYHNRLIAAGTHDWEYVQKYFAPRKPVKKLTLYVAARGMDGKMMGRTLVGTAWVDRVALDEVGTSGKELGARGIKAAAASAISKADSLVVTDFDPGERLWGENAMRVRIHNPMDKALPVVFGLTSPSGEAIGPTASAGEIAAHTTAEITVPFNVNQSGADGHCYRISGSVSLTFAAPAAPVSIRMGNICLFPSEKLEVGINLNLAKATIALVKNCKVVVEHPGGDKMMLDTEDVPGAMAGGKETPSLLREGYVDARNLVDLVVDTSGLPVHSAANPMRDCVVRVTLKDAAGKTMFTQESEPFGVMERPAMDALPATITQTKIGEGGWLTVNGRPFSFRPFPLDNTDLGNMSRRSNLPKECKILPLPFPKELKFAAGSDEEWKKKTQEFVGANKGDPKLLGYFFDHDGETTFWFDDWKQMAACQRKVVGWAREIDSNHVIMSAQWLFGHGALKPAMAEYFGFLDVIDVEPGLTWTPDANAFREKAGRPVCVVAGLECYHYQSPNVLRWRMYEAMRQGVNDIGICPSGMLSARPESVSLLRSLYAESAALRAALSAPTPKVATACDNGAVRVWERETAAGRYVIAMRESDGESDSVTAKFTLPVDSDKVEVLFEPRKVTAADRSFTDVFGKYAVHVYRVGQ